MYSPSKVMDLIFTLFQSVAPGSYYESGKKMFLIPPLNLMLLAAMVHPDDQVEIVDERTCEIKYDDNIDLVGITCMTADANRAYEIANKFRKRGVKVVLGGIHPTVMPVEASEYADAVVIGEAEGVFNDLLDDAKKGALQKFYASKSFHNMKNLPFPRRDLIHKEFYLTKNVIQTTRGCPHNCVFCSGSIIAGREYRCRPIEDVIDEINAMEGDFFVFLDDNAFANRDYAQRLLQEIEPLNKAWYGNVTTRIAADQETIKLAARSGCKAMLIGFESLSRDALGKVNKKLNQAEDYPSLVKQLHDLGIGVIGSFILGLDDDTLRHYDEIVDLAMKTDMDVIQISILTPYPGTRLFKEMDDAGRIVTKDWRYYDTTLGQVVYEPCGIGKDQLQECYFKLYEKLYSYRSIVSRLWGSKCFPQLFVPYNLRQRKKILLAKRMLAARP
jgi:radical SAM superfamily enzyme YgiQ (UPF0313 family)